jgi:hypothetical protein
MAPAPGDSMRPRANTTSTSGHAADAVGISVDAGVSAVAGAIKDAVASSPAAATRANRRAAADSIIGAACGDGSIA